MKFRAMTTGVLDLGIIRIVDLETRLTVDVKELPDVVAFETDRSDRRRHVQHDTCRRRLDAFLGYNPRHAMQRPLQDSNR